MISQIFHPLQRFREFQADNPEQEIWNKLLFELLDEDTVDKAINQCIEFIHTSEIIVPKPLIEMAAYDFSGANPDLPTFNEDESKAIFKNVLARLPEKPELAKDLINDTVSALFNYLLEENPDCADSNFGLIYRIARYNLSGFTQKAFHIALYEWLERSDKRNTEGLQAQWTFLDFMIRQTDPCFVSESTFDMLLNTPANTTHHSLNPYCVDPTKLDSTIRLMSTSHPEALCYSLKQHIACLSDHSDLPQDMQTTLRRFLEDLHQSNDADQYNFSF